jgi:hypothetical protein
VSPAHYGRWRLLWFTRVKHTATIMPRVSRGRSLKRLQRPSRTLVSGNELSGLLERNLSPQSTPEFPNRQRLSVMRLGG